MRNCGFGAQGNIRIKCAERRQGGSLRDPAGREVSSEQSVVSLGRVCDSGLVCGGGKPIVLKPY